MDHHSATGPSVPARWWGPATTVTNADVMNQLCRVCGEPAAGFHFGAFTCEGCKSFFGRTYNNLSSVSECKNNGECVINKKNRTSCKACRLRKCLLVGMSKSGSRYGRRSNWFKIHCLLQEQQLQHQHHQQNQIQQLHPNQHPSTPSLSTKKPWEYAKNAATLLDIDNNNTPIEHAKSESPPATFATNHGLLKSSDTAAFWSARHPSLTVPHQQALPYFISPFLPSPLSPVTHNYLLPFLPLRPPLPLEPLVISSTPPSSLHSSPSPLITPLKETRTPEDTDKSSSLEKLRSLGPVQEQPIDLSSSKVVEEKALSPRTENNQKINLHLNNRQNENQKRTENDERGVKSTTPLDLRCSKS